MPNDPAKAAFTPTEIPRHGLDTPYGYLYRPLSDGKQIMVLIAVFFGGPGFGWVVAQVPGDLSQTARDVMFVPMMAVFFIGYALWIARLNAIAFQGIGWGLIKMAFNFLVFRRKPESPADILPSRDKLLEMLVRAQKAGASFAPAGWLVGLASGAIAALAESAMSATNLFLLVAGSCLIWGYLLAWLGRRGWLPFMESN
jgi:hypothetical protein